MGGLEKLVDFVLGWIRILRFWIIVDENSEGIVLRFGRFKRLDPERHKGFVWRGLCRLLNGYQVRPGFHVKLFAWDEEFVVSLATETNNLGVQSLITRNGSKLQVSGVYKYSISDPYKYFIEIGDEASFLDDLFYGAIADEILAADWPFDVEEMKKRIVASIRNEARKYGFKIHTFKFDNMVPSGTLRLFNE